MTKRQSFLFALVLFLTGVFIVLATLRLENIPIVLEQLKKIFASGWPQRNTALQESWREVVVERVIDGDTIEIGNGVHIRYIGINAPESVKPGSLIECFGEESSLRNKELVEGKTIRLEKDISEKDKYGRLLRYVYLQDGTLVNEILVREGYAYAFTFPPDVKLKNLFQQAENEARKKKVGLWMKTACGGKNKK